jgi:hypothetical protein
MPCLKRKAKTGGYMTLRLYLVAPLFFSAALTAVPATHAYLSVPPLRELAYSSWGAEIALYKNIVDQALERETAYEHTHHVFYHAQKCEFRIVQDFLKNLYQLMHPDIVIENFHFLRAWYEFPKTINASSFINEHEEYENGLLKDWNDNRSYLAKRMLSVNFSLFGSTKNYSNFGECTFKYFFKNKSIKMVDLKQLLEGIFEHFGYNKKYVADLLALSKTIETNEGSLFQIFVPIDKVDTITFAAQRLGTPYRNSLFMPHLFNHKLQRYPTLTPILDAYRNYPGQFGLDLDRLQGRILFSQDLLLNPKSGIQIFRYTTINLVKLKNYETELKKLTEKIFVSKAELPVILEKGIHGASTLLDMLVHLFKQPHVA